ncbi:hypothetical protein GF326_05795 [Candidatus Bathyarchaeota archaeon]|nr:hypothetical protein [Candidatus Bathyarchaeota archaeon]
MSGANGRLEELEKTWSKARTLVEEIEEEISSSQTRLLDLMTQRISFEKLNTEHLPAFAEKPYVILPKASNEYWVIAPRFLPFQIGWLERQTDSYNIFIVNKYIDWIAPLPHDLKARLGMKPYLSQAIVKDRGDLSPALEVSPEEKEKAQEKYRKYLGSSVPNTDNLVYIQKGKEFELIAELIDDGMLPYEPRPVMDSDLRPDPDTIQLRDYQERAWSKLLDYGAIGVFWAPGAGKTYISLYAGNRIKGKKLVVVPTATLREQWRQRIRDNAIHSHEWEVQTYQYITAHHLEKYQKNQYKLIIYDEVHHLPSNTFSKLATLDTKYRIGLSASPYREDGRTEYIFALTGFPVGLKWRELISLGVVQEPDVRVYLYSTASQKKADVTRIIDSRVGKILVYCDSIVKGKRLSRELEVPFVYGDTRNRMEILTENRVVIASRVADEGVSLPDLDVVVEYDFLYGSRRQEAQRAGRVMHGKSEGEHIILMTEDELTRYEKRLYSLEEQGFRIRYERRH